MFIGNGFPPGLPSPVTKKSPTAPRLAAPVTPTLPILVRGF